MNLKKSIAALLVLATLLLVSCGGEESKSESSAESGSEISEIVSTDNSSVSESQSGADESEKTDDSKETAGETSSEAPSENESSELSESSEEPSEVPSEEPSKEESSKEETSKEETSKEESSEDEKPSSGVGNKDTEAANLDKIPEFSGTGYIVIDNNMPFFTAAQLTTSGYEKYGALDNLGRCTTAIASLGKETMPTEDRGSISSVKPTGWIQAKYSCIKTSDLYNRSHLIAWSLSGENANKQNLVTGTAYLNQDNMTQFEDMVLDYIKETGNHVAYRVTPLFKGNDLVCRGVQMEAYSIEDDGEGICFNVYCYNVQPGVIIDYATGESHSESGEESSEESSVDTSIEADYVLNVSSKKIHAPDCSSVAKMSDKNRKNYTGSIDELLAQGYKPCGSCNAGN
ncbi:MAG: DNA/RNA non-specific endonuclease [Clostridia bacterium]|nr:DNA/RNA non-specific endonuclease [Clostridia bacterium]